MSESLFSVCVVVYGIVARRHIPIKIIIIIIIIRIFIVHGSAVLMVRACRVTLPRAVNPVNYVILILDVRLNNTQRLRMNYIVNSGYSVARCRNQIERSKKKTTTL